MSRKGLIVIIVLVLILLGLLGGLYYYLQAKSAAPGSTSSGFTLGNLFPFGKAPLTPTTNTENNTSNQSNNVNSNPNGEVSNTVPPLLRRIAEFPIAGATIFDRVIGTSTKKETVSVIRYMERSTGNVYEASTSTLDLIRISNTTFPKVHEAIFDSTGENVIARTMPSDDDEIISTYYGHLKKLTATSTEQMLETTLLSNSSDVVITSPIKNKIFSLGNEGGEKGVISKFDGSGKNTVFTSLLKEWLPTWPSEDNIVLSTKPSASVEGVAYLLNIPTKNTKKIGVSLAGLTVSVSPNLANILYSESDSKNHTIIFGLMDKDGKAPTPLFLKTLPEKCVWSQKEKNMAFCAVPDSLPAATYPDDWYSGKISFADSIWKINVLNGEVRDIAPIREMVKTDIDAINLSLDSKEDYLLFTNKKDLSLWGLQLKASVTPTASSTI